MISAALLIVVVPLIGAALAYGVRRWPSLELLVALLACLGVIVLLSQPLEAAIAFPGLPVGPVGIDVDQPVTLLGRVLRVRAPERIPLLLLFVCAAMLFAMSWRTSPGWPFIPIGLAMLAAMSIALLIRPFVYAALALEGAAALAALMIQAERSGERATMGALRYLSAITLALPLFLFAGWAIDRVGNVSLNDADALRIAYEPAIVLLIGGFGLMLGAIPLFSWIHPVAKDAPPLTTAFIATVGVGAVSALLLGFWQEYAWLRTSSVAVQALTIGGIGLLLFGGGLAWAQHTFSRVMACAIFVEIGCLLLVLSNSSQLSVESLTFAAPARALSLGVFGLGVWRLRELRASDAFADARGVRDLWTILALGVGGLSLAGLPGTLGFVSRWSAARAYSATDAEGLALLVLAGASVGVGVLRGLIGLLTPPHPEAAVVAHASVGAQLGLFDQAVGARSEVVREEVGQQAPSDPLLLVGESLIEGEVRSPHSGRLAQLDSVGAKFVIGVGVGALLILGLWPGVIVPLAKAAALQYSFYP